MCKCVFIPSLVRMGSGHALYGDSGNPIPLGTSFFEFETKPTGKDRVDPAQSPTLISAPQIIGQKKSISKHRSKVKQC